MKTNRRLIRTVSLLAFLLIPIPLLPSGDSLRAFVYFDRGSSTLESILHDNARELESFVSSIRSVGKRVPCHPRHIRIISGSSVEGNPALNERLSWQRAIQIRSYLQERLSFPDSLFVLSSRGEDWDGLYRLVVDSDLPCRGEILTVLNEIMGEADRGDMTKEKLKSQLMMLHEGRVWHHMLRHFMPELRRGIIVCEFEEAQPAHSPTIQIREGKTQEGASPIREFVGAVPDTVIPPRGGMHSGIPENTHGHCRMALKSNLLYDIALVPNIGLEYALDRGWSVGCGWQYAWWKNDSRHDYWRVYGGELEIRKYFGAHVAEKAFAGHHAGLYLQALTYDFELGGPGYLSRFSYGGGFEYGYSLSLHRQLRLDFSIGIGCLSGRYEQYTPADSHYVWERTGMRYWFGPTRAGISLLWLPGNGCRKSRKGGVL